MYSQKTETDYSKSKKMEHIDELINFIRDISNQSNELLKSSILELNHNLNEIEVDREKLAKINSDTNYLFTPNNNLSNTNDINSEIIKIENSIKEQKKEQDELKKRISLFNEILNILEENRIPKRDINFSILMTQEQDRQRIARDLHDSTVQDLTGLMYKIDLCTRLIDMDPIRTKLELSAITGTIKSIISEIRDIIYNLKPMSLDDLGFIVTVERYAKQLMTSHNIIVNVKYNEKDIQLIQIVQLSLLRVIQEACNNVIKHANATKIDIEINYFKNRIKVLVKDNGIGFDIKKQTSQSKDNLSGYGLIIMNERIHLLSGSITIQSEIDNGTIVTVDVPLSKCEVDEDE